jgi:hypothetical protein
MDTGTLIKVVAMLDARVVEKVGIIWDDVWEDGYNQGYVDALREVSSHLQSAIDADVAAMESATGE